MGLLKSSSPLLAAGVVCVAASLANADISDIIFQVRAENALGTAVFEHRFDLQYWNDETQTYEWNLLNPVMMLDEQGREIAQLTRGDVLCVGDPVVNLGFAVQAGVLNTTFTITSAHLSFGTIATAAGRAAAGLSISDLTGDGVSLTQNGAPIYTSQYNGFVPSGTVFADLLGAGLSDPTAFGAANTSDEFPGGGLYSAIGVPVSDISSRFRFALTAGDIASGTSSFEVIPAPATLTLLSLGGILAIRRRSR
jgi:hypothetical protein